MTSFVSDRGRLLKLLAAPALLAMVSACATGFNADVSRFQSQLPAPQGQTFAVVADDPALAGGLEFSQYANFVEAEMQRLGYTEAAPENATLLVRFDYGVDNGREQVRSSGFRSPFYDPWYGYSRFGYGHNPFYRSRFYGRSAYAFGFYDPFFDAGPDIRSVTVYTSGIDLKIDRASNGERLFEGKAQALSRSNRLQALVPNLVEAMFTDFPGNSGETVRISVKDDAPNTVRRID